MTIIIEDSDREAAQEAWDHCSEDDDLVYLFAAHRLQERERAAKVAEDTANEKNAHPEFNAACWEIAAAIRGQS